ncbi:unnamed protein product [Soboliphyme baturini]|uniref:WD_REPEATS_REGION domain-containing protein n=1 Tax=Soboliphyme baturini TaxID=241478 RepID=A0A183J8E2_9BILA|nr:unnamed protein product [Soboliphyme baturini]
MCVASASADRSVRIWSTTCARPVRILSELTSAVTELVASPDGLSLITADRQRHLTFWDVRMWKILQSLSTKNVVYTARFSPEGRTLAIAGAKGFFEQFRLSGHDVVCYARFSPGRVSYDSSLRFLTSRFCNDTSVFVGAA